MKSLRELYRIGRGPSSSHTMGIENAALRFKELFPNADRTGAVLYGSLALTGKGHRTDEVLRNTLPNCEVVFDKETNGFLHPNTLDLTAYSGEALLGERRFYSLGGGAIKMDGEEYIQHEVYPEKNFSEIIDYCNDNNIRIPDYVEEREGKEIWEYLEKVWTQMKQTIAEGLKKDGIIPGGLNLTKKAKMLFRQKHIDERPETKENRIVCAYAFAAAEQNSDCGIVVTAPTCGSSGVLPAVMRYTHEKYKLTDEDIIRALATAGVVGNVVKTNASISGAMCGCQAEIGTACSMAAAALAEACGMDLNQIECAAEIAMEHHLGLTCDPVNGLVQIPCIERNAVAAMRAINAVSLANFLSAARTVPFDTVVETMYETGIDMGARYRETSEGGLAKLYRSDKVKR